MRREDVLDLFARIPDVDHAKVQIVMRAGASCSVDTVMRLEPTYAVFRGREAGNQDEGRAFFIPYDEMVFFKLERLVKSVELEEWYQDLPDMEKKGDAGEAAATAAAAAKEQVPMDPSEIARQNLLARIRAARTVTKK